MSQLPINPLSPEEQQKIMGQMYLLMGKQVQSYHKHRHMGTNSSVPVELAQELMESIEYTTGLVGGVYAHGNIDEALVLGQEILESKLSKAKSMLDLVSSTAPEWQTECRWEALQYLRHYLKQYDHLHLAHKGPDELFYPILISMPEGIKGIDSCLFYLKIMWVENQIMAALSDEKLKQFWDRLPSTTLNQCEQLLINGIGKTFLGSDLYPLFFETDEYIKIIAAFMHATEETLVAAAKNLCQRLDLHDEDTRMYVEAVIPQLTLWIENTSSIDNLDNLFI